MPAPANTPTPAPMVLPPGLRGWEEALTVLEDDVVLGLGPLLRALNEAMADGTDSAHPVGEPDGFDGITARGAIDQVLMSEWLLMDELPEEFLRRFAMSELQYLKPARRSPKPTGRVVLLVDAGPDQLGVRRVVQLAALLVLCRRASARGTEVQLGVLGDPPDLWTTGEPAGLVRAWLSARTNERPDPTVISDRIGLLNPEDQVWIFSSLPAPLRITASVHRLFAVESAWNPEQATHLAITVDQRKLQLEAPPTAVTIRILRGQGFRPVATSTQSRLIDRQPIAAFRFPAFAGSARRLMFRGENSARIVSLTVPTGGTRTYEPVAYTFPGRVIALCTDPNRTVGLYEDNGILAVKVFGKSLANLAAIRYPIERLGLEIDDIDQLASGPPAPLFFQSGELLIRLKGRTFRIDHKRITEAPRIRLMQYWRLVDQPLVLTQTDQVISASQLPDPIELSDADAAFTAGNHTIGISDRPDAWTLYSTAKAPKFGDPSRGVSGQSIGVVEVSPGDTVKGIIRDPSEPWLVTLSPGNQIVRLYGTRTTRVLTEFSGDILDVSVHPTIPLLAIQYRDGRTAAVDMVSLKQLVDVSDRTRIIDEVGVES